MLQDRNMRIQYFHCSPNIVKKVAYSMWATGHTDCWQDAARHVYCARWIKQRCNRFKQRTCWRPADSSSESSWSFPALSSASLSHRTLFLERWVSWWSHLPAPSSSDWFWLRLPWFLVDVLARLIPCWRAIERESYICRIREVNAWTWRLVIGEDVEVLVGNLK